MLREVCLLESEPLHERARGGFPFAQHLDNRDPRRVGQCLEDVGFELLDGGLQSLSIFEIMNISKS